MPDYPLLCRQLAALAEGQHTPLPILANAAALLWESLPQINWCGFYLARGEELLLGPFAGKPACMAIPFGKGVCGTAAATRSVQRVPDVHAFPGHIACDGASRSELVIPLLKDGAVLGVLDIDAPIPDRFSDADAAGLTAFAQALLRGTDWSRGLL